MQLTNLLIIGCTLATPSQVSFYTNHKVIEFPNSKTINQLLKINNADIWSETPQTVRARLTPVQFSKLQSELPPSFNFNVLVEDVQQTIDESNETPTVRSGDWFSSYHTYDEIKAWYKKHAQSNPDAVKFVSSIGKTLQKNDIFAVHLTNPNGAPKKKIWFESLIHAREWITGPTTQYIFNEFLAKRESDPTIKKILDEVEIIFIPIVNPDGYKFTQIHRLWRKNCNGSGVDINRNFPYNWGKEGASTNPLADDYRGKSAGSELETQAITKYYSAQSPIAGAIDWHSYSELVLRPWGDTTVDSPHESQHKELGDGIVEKIKLNRGKVYTSQKSIGLYPTSGTADDWFYGAKGSYSFTIELSPNADAVNGFVLPPSEIIPVAKDLLPAAIYFIQFVLKNPIN